MKNLNVDSDEDQNPEALRRAIILNPTPCFYDSIMSSLILTCLYLSRYMIEIVCKVCGAHLGHKFDDAKLHNPDVEGDTRYCINGVALQFLNKTSQKQKAEEQVYQ